MMNVCQKSVYLDTKYVCLNQHLNQLWSGSGSKHKWMHLILFSPTMISSVSETWNTTLNFDFAALIGSTVRMLLGRLICAWGKAEACVWQQPRDPHRGPSTASWDISGVCILPTLLSDSQSAHSRLSSDLVVMMASVGTGVGTGVRVGTVLEK